MAEPVFKQTFDSPLGPVAIAADNERVCSVEFCDGRLSDIHMRTGKRAGLVKSHTSINILAQLNSELNDYFDGKLRRFSVPLSIIGTPFQERVWREIARIPYGKTISYQQLAERIGRPTAVRAVGRATGTNPISIVIPCHRVIGKDGSLTGYGGGLWRKRRLLKLEQSGKLSK